MPENLKKHKQLRHLLSQYCKPSTWPQAVTARVIAFWLRTNTDGITFVGWSLSLMTGVQSLGKHVRRESFTRLYAQVALLCICQVVI